jgi:5-methylcytosine-specific restriction endonuclease McrA
MIALAMFSIESVLPFTGRGRKSKIYYAGQYGYSVNMDSIRYEVFKKSLDCIKCGKPGDVFILQYPAVKRQMPKCTIKNCYICSRGIKIPHKEPDGWEKPHFNLYHIDNDGNTILMTKDHRIPKSKKGTNSISNIDTMCTICNAKKGNSMPDDLYLEMG